MESYTREDFTFFHSLRVRWAEVDAQGIVFNPHYLTYIDVAMTEYMREIGVPYPSGLLKLGSDTFAARSEINFRRPAEFDDTLELGARISRIGNTSLTMSFGLFREDELLCDAEMVYVNADPESRKPIPVPEPLIDAITAFEKHQPERK